MKHSQYINTGKVAKLSDVVMSGDVGDRDIVKVYDAEGKFITKGNWFQDHVLDWAGFYGIASKAGSGLTVSFQLA